MTDPTPPASNRLDRRQLLGAGSFAALGMLFGGGLVAEEFAPAPAPGDAGPAQPVGCAVIGLG
ncbi:MAG: hypothetical protein H0X38_16830, partial [Planctomycetes bacterium]|nr:hypothetical protein [Planctomycetota bacterium]